MKLFAFTVFGAVVTCVVLSLDTNGSNAADSQNIKDGAFGSLSNNSETEYEVELLIPQLSVMNEELSGSNDSDSDVTYSVIQTSTDVQLSTVIRSSQCFIVPNTSRAATFLDIVMGFSDSTFQMLSSEESDSRYQLSSGVKKVTCIPRNTSDLDSMPTVKIVNSSELLQQLGSRNSSNGRCTIVLFYAPWCLFSAQVAPHYNALARAFPKLDVYAIDAFHFSNLNSRFGTIAVPNVMIFHSAKAIARFNGSERTLTSLVYFVSNVTGVQANLSVEVMPEDYIGPLQSEPSQETDYLLLLSWVFVILCCALGALRSSTGVRVWNTLVAMGHHEQHHHQHID